MAVAHAILTGTDYATSLKKYAQRYYNLPYGGSFKRWMWTWESEAYNSWGNGSAMRVSPVGFAYDSLEDVLYQSEASALVTHNHPEGVKGAQATSVAIYLARHGADKDTIRNEISGRFGYDLNRTVDEIRPHYSFDISCQGSVPESIVAFLDSEDFEGAIRNAISLGGDADTMACIAGGVTQAYYKHVPEKVVDHVRNGLPKDLLEVLEQFNNQYNCEF